MIKIKLINGKIVEVKPNEAHTLIESGKGALYVKKEVKQGNKTYKTRSKRRYSNKMMTSEE